MTDKMEFIWVEAASGDRVGMYEEHPDHPPCERFPAGGIADVVPGVGPVQVALTPGVASKLGRMEIRRVDAPKAERAPRAKKEVVLPPVKQVDGLE